MAKISKDMFSSYKLLTNYLLQDDYIVEVTMDGTGAEQVGKRLCMHNLKNCATQKIGANT